MSDNLEQFQSEGLAGFIEKERERLTQEREKLLSERAGIVEYLDGHLAAIDREFAAIDAYERVRTGKPTRAASSATRARRGSRREAILQAVGAAVNGLSRGDLLDVFGLKGDKLGEMSVSNALATMMKNGQLVREDGRYFVNSAANQMRQAAE
jgi:hypothetical protein